MEEAYCFKCKDWRKSRGNHLRGTCINARALDEAGTPDFFPHVDFGCKYFKEIKTIEELYNENEALKNKFSRVVDKYSDLVDKYVNIETQEIKTGARR